MQNWYNPAMQYNTNVNSLLRRQYIGAEKCHLSQKESTKGC